MITTILTVSRTTYLDRILDSLKNQTYKSENLIVIFDGSDNDFITVRNKVVGIDYQHVLCVKSNFRQKAYAIPDRRWHITNIHNQLRTLIGPCDWVFSVEDDGILPPDALQKLVESSKHYQDVGMITGVELGRWGVPYVGAWRVDNVWEPSSVVSMESHAGEKLIEEIDGCGLYCALIDAGVYLSHDFTIHNGLGPDVNLGLYARQKEYRNYINWDICVTHLTSSHGLELEIAATDTALTVVLTKLGNNSWHQAKYFGENSGQSGYGSL